MVLNDVESIFRWKENKTPVVTWTKNLEWIWTQAVLWPYEPEIPWPISARQLMITAHWSANGTSSRADHKAAELRKNNEKVINKNQRFCPTSSELRHE